MKYCSLFITLLLWQTQLCRAEAAKLTVLTEHLPPLQMADKGRVVGGLATEVVQAMLKQADEQASIKAFIWARTYKMALYGENVMIYSITRTAERESKFKWVGLLLTLDNYLWRLDSRKDISLSALKDGKRFRTAVPRNDIQHQFLLSKGFEEPRHLEVVTRYGHAVEMLFRGRVDMIAGTKLLLIERLKTLNKTVDQLHPVLNMAPGLGKLYIAFSLKTPDERVEKFRRALNTIKNNGRYDAIMDKWHKHLKVLPPQ